MFSDSKRARMKKKTERRENRSTNTVMQGCGKITKKKNSLRMNQACVANRVKQKRTNKQNNCPESWKSLFRASTVQTFFLGECERSIYEKRAQTPSKIILYIRLVKITTTFGLN